MEKGEFPIYRAKSSAFANEHSNAVLGMRRRRTSRNNIIFASSQSRESLSDTRHVDIFVRDAVTSIRDVSPLSYYVHNIYIYIQNAPESVKSSYARFRGFAKFEILFLLPSRVARALALLAREFPIFAALTS